MGSGVGAVLVETPVGLLFLNMAAGKFLVAVLLLGASDAKRTLRGNARPSVDNRDARSLVNTFPFNANSGNGHHGNHHDHHEEPARRAFTGLDSRNQRQGGDDTDVSFPAVAAARPGNDGRRCIDKVEMIEETEYESQQEEDCEENFRKTCFIEYEKIAFNETVEVCRTPLVKNCDIQGPEICRTEYESECWTKQEVHDVQDDVVECRTEVEEKCVDNTSGYTTNTECSKWPKEVCNVSKKNVKKYTPITGCTKEPRELCAPACCGFSPGAEECYEKVQTVVSDSPKEQCSLEPQRTCKHVTKLVPKLTPTEECVDVPKEVCTRSRTNPRQVKKPVVKKWCYVPTEESGLA